GCVKWARLTRLGDVRKVASCSNYAPSRSRRMLALPAGTLIVFMTQVYFWKLRLPIGGQNMLEGLTRDEAREFESLSKPAPVADEFEARIRDARWIDLYLKHERAKLS